MKKLLPLILAFAMVIPSMAADTSEANTKAIELMKLLEIRKNIDASMAQIMAFSDQMIDSQNLDPEVAALAKKSSKGSMEATIEAMQNMEWEAMFADIYSNVFSAEEIQGLIDFYETPLGKKLLEKQPELMAATMQKMQGEMSKFMPKIQAAAMKAVQEAKAEKVELQDQE